MNAAASPALNRPAPSASIAPARPAPAKATAERRANTRPPLRPPRSRRPERIALAAFVALAHAGGIAGLIQLAQLDTRPAEITPIEIAFIPAEAPPTPEPVVAPPTPPVEIPKPTPPKPKPVVKHTPKPTPVKPAVEEPVTTSESALTSAAAEPAPPVEATPPAPPAPPAPPVAAAPAPAPVTAARYDADYLNNPKPSYPPLSRRMREEGTVVLRVLVSAEGLPARIELDRSSGSERLDKAALAAVDRWRFVAAREGERSIEAWVKVPVVFKLEGI